jgi:hypothetical protein
MYGIEKRRENQLSLHRSRSCGVNQRGEAENIISAWLRRNPAEEKCRGERHRKGGMAAK